MSVKNVGVTGESVSAADLLMRLQSETMEDEDSIRKICEEEEDLVKRLKLMCKTGLDIPFVKAWISDEAHLRKLVEYCDFTKPYGRIPRKGKRLYSVDVLSRVAESADNIREIAYQCVLDDVLRYTRYTDFNTSSFGKEVLDGSISESEWERVLSAVPGYNVRYLVRIKNNPERYINLYANNLLAIRAEMSNGEWQKRKGSYLIKNLDEWAWDSITSRQLNRLIEMSVMEFIIAVGEGYKLSDINLVECIGILNTLSKCKPFKFEEYYTVPNEFTGVRLMSVSPKKLECTPTLDQLNEEKECEVQPNTLMAVLKFMYIRKFVKKVSCLNFPKLYVGRLDSFKDEIKHLDDDLDEIQQSIQSFKESEYYKTIIKSSYKKSNKF